MDVVLLTGMSGAGRSTAARALEDIGFFVTDNLPPQLLPELLQIAHEQHLERIAVVVDVRGGRMFADLDLALERMRQAHDRPTIVFLEASDDVLVRRFESNRRPHPLQGAGRVLDGLGLEREVLAPLRGDADLLLDTSPMTLHDLRRAVERAFDVGTPALLKATVVSFGFKYGIPVDADFVADMRFLPNPYWVPELRDLTGRDAAVNDYVVSRPGAAEFLEHYSALIHSVADGYLVEGKRFVTIAVGCTGGKHRSVAIAENLAVRLVKVGVESTVIHRDLGRE
ncbi:MAG: RNase adapter RapZ [Candidatus Nanopelagicales bacterium]